MRVLAALGGSVILSSATLPVVTGGKLVDAFRSKLAATGYRMFNDALSLAWWYLLTVKRAVSDVWRA